MISQEDARWLSEKFGLWKDSSLHELERHLRQDASNFQLPKRCRDESLEELRLVQDEIERRRLDSLDRRDWR